LLSGWRADTSTKKMTRQTKIWLERNPPIALWLAVILWLSIASSTTIWSGCKTQPLVLPADKVVTLLRAGQTLKATNDVYLVPPARMQEILHQLSDKLGELHPLEASGGGK
jgi:hypothetical protein